MQKLLSILLTLALSSLCATAATIRVPADRPTIQAAIDVAADGDTVLLADGSYGYEGNANIRVHGKAITIRSENGPDNCELYASGWLYAFKLDRGEGRNTVIQGLTITAAGTGIYVKDSSPTIRNCVLNECGTGILVVVDLTIDATPHIDCTRFTDNQGYGIRINEKGHALITDSEIRGNGLGWYGKGGVFINVRSGASIQNCLIAGNNSTTNGGGINCEGSLTISNCTIVDNHAEENGGGLYCSDASSTLSMENCIITGNSAQTGDQYALYSWEYLPSFYDISYTDVVGETYADPDCLELGEGMLDENPLFVSGPSGDHYLSQTAAGQGADSPCVDTGNPESLMVFVTTRTDLVQDAGVVDMGYHYPNPGHDHLPDTFILSGPGGTVSFYRTTSPVVSFSFTGSDEEYPASSLTYSWRINDDTWSSWSPGTWATISGLDEDSDITFEVRARDPQGDMDPSPARRTFRITDPIYLDYLDRIVVAPGPGYGNPPLVKTELGQWLAYGVAHYGVNVAAGDIDGDGTDEVITGPGPGEVFGPHVRCFQPDGTVVPNAGFMAYGTNRFGVNVAAGDIDGDGNDEIITGAGPGDVFGPHVRGWNWDGGPSSLPIPGISFFAYGTLKYGVNVTCGDITGDGIDEIITGPGPGEMFGAHVRGWRFDGSTISPMSDVSWLAFSPHKWGVKVACGDLDGDGYDEIITGIGPRENYGPLVRTWNYDGSSISLMPGIDFLAYPHGRYGVTVGATNVDGIGGDELLTMPGPGPMNQPWLRAWHVDEGTPTMVYHGGSYNLYILDVWLTHGGNVAGSKNGWE